MNKKVVAAGSALVSVALALGVGFGVASATEPPPSGDNCTVNGNFNIVIAPNCQAGTPTAPTSAEPYVPTLVPFEPSLSGFNPPPRTPGP